MMVPAKLVRLHPRYMAGPEQVLFIARDGCATCHGVGRYVSPLPAVGTGPMGRPRMGDESSGQCRVCADAIGSLLDSDIQAIIDAGRLDAGSLYYPALYEQKRRLMGRPS